MPTTHRWPALAGSPVGLGYPIEADAGEKHAMLRALAFAVVILLALPAHGQGFETGLAAYESGDYARAQREWTLMAEAGDALPPYLLGVMYGNGWGVAQDYVRAHMWFDIAAAHGFELGLKGGRIVARKMTPAKVAEAHRLAQEWLEAHQ